MRHQRGGGPFNPRCRSRRSPQFLRAHTIHKLSFFLKRGAGNLKMKKKKAQQRIFKFVVSSEGDKDVERCPTVKRRPTRPFHQLITTRGFCRARESMRRTNWPELPRLHFVCVLKIEITWQKKKKKKTEERTSSFLMTSNRENMKFYLRPRTLEPTGTVVSIARFVRASLVTNESRANDVVHLRNQTSKIKIKNCVAFFNFIRWNCVGLD